MIGKSCMSTGGKVLITTIKAFCAGALKKVKNLIYC